MKKMVVLILVLFLIFLLAMGVFLWVDQQMAKEFFYESIQVIDCVE